VAPTAEDLTRKPQRQARKEFTEKTARANIGRRRQPYWGVVLLLTVFSVLSPYLSRCVLCSVFFGVGQLSCGQQRVILVNICRQRRAGRDVHVFSVLDQTDRAEEDCQRYGGANLAFPFLSLAAAKAQTLIV